MAKTNKERQAAFKARQVNKGKQQLAVFVSDDAYLIIKRRAEQDGTTVSEAVENAITSNISSNEKPKPITSNLVRMTVHPLPPNSEQRNIKCECPSCGYTIRTTKRWIECAVPICPVCSRIALA